MEKLVSILTPCYNSEKYIDRYAESLLAQEYSNCQLIFMDDGSTDNSKEKIMKYKDAFEKKGFIFEYHYHENIGVGATIAEGIRYVVGDYLTWPDVDDALSADSIIKKVKFLDQHPEYGLVRTDFAKVYDDAPDVVVERGAQKYPNRWKEALFKDYLLSNQAWLQGGCFMVRMTSFLKANPDRYIYPTRRGQNWQMLLPLLYEFKCGYIDEPLFYYLLRNGSLSDISNETYDDRIRKYELYEELIIDTVNHMHITESEKKSYIEQVQCHYIKEKISHAFFKNNRKEVQKYYKKLKELGVSDKNSYIKSLITGTVFAKIYMKLRIKDATGKK